MRIRVLEHNDDKVLFSTENGTGMGLWKDKDMPIEQDYSIEFLTNDIISKDRLKLSQSDTPRIEIVGNYVLFVGRVAYYYERGSTITLDLGTGYIDFIIDDSIDINEINGKYVEVLSSNVGIYDEHHY